MELMNQLKKLKQLKNKAMKKVIIEQNEPVIHLENVKDNMIIGILWLNGDKSFLIKDDEDRTVGIELNRLTTFYNWVAKDHKDYIKKACNFKDIFVFDSPKELAQWLAE